MKILKKIEEIVKDQEIVLFMKGTPDSPQCGFSKKVVGILDLLPIEYAIVNVLDDEQIRQGIKDFSNWPTIPQLYIKGTFIGGCDIVTQLYEQEKLQGMLTSS